MTERQSHRPRLQVNLTDVWRCHFAPPAVEIAARVNGEKPCLCRRSDRTGQTSIHREDVRRAATRSGLTDLRQDGPARTLAYWQPDRFAPSIWGPYEIAIRRWEHTIGRPAPDPTGPGPSGMPRLATVFVEWLMGLPPGHITGADLPRAAQLRLLGNSAVPRQVEHALRILLTALDEPRCVANHPLATGAV
ncbi:hypothetical protein [Fodinicola acaciae]|uniref:hypothetical protein n=1 Tax=Fodinicola acaciae TaxID=2681555 RepID=UPI0013D15B86|nr:hypothetical protein [Fodinicola acaciae]